MPAMRSSSYDVVPAIVALISSLAPETLALDLLSDNNSPLKYAATLATEMVNMKITAVGPKTARYALRAVWTVRASRST